MLLVENLAHLRRVALDDVDDDVGIEQVFQHGSECFAIRLFLAGALCHEVLAW